MFTGNEEYLVERMDMSPGEEECLVESLDMSTRKEECLVERNNVYWKGRISTAKAGYIY